MQMRKQRGAAIIVAAIFVLALLLSCDFLLSNSEHDCACCNDCPVCAVLEVAREVSGAKRKTNAAIAILTASAFACVLSLFVKKGERIAENPVSLYDVLTI